MVSRKLYSIFGIHNNLVMAKREMIEKKKLNRNIVNKVTIVEYNENCN